MKNDYQQPDIKIINLVASEAITSEWDDGGEDGFTNPNFSATTEPW